jgi:hypothetical protein
MFFLILSDGPQSRLAGLLQRPDDVGIQIALRRQVASWKRPTRGRVLTRAQTEGVIPIRHSPFENRKSKIPNPLVFGGEVVNC